MLIYRTSFIGEPWLLLAELFFDEGSFTEAYICANKSVLRFLQLGTAFDKRFPFPSWVAAARVMRGKSLG